MTSILKTALSLRKLGVSCIPVHADKTPLITSWRDYMTKVPSEEDQRNWFSDGASIALVAGKVQCIDVDEKYRAGLMADFEGRVNDAGLSDIWRKVLIQSTPSGGYHLAFCSQSEPIRNMRLAAKANKEVLIETRGFGGYFLISPSPGYEIIQGDFESLPVLTDEERADLMEVARSFNEFFRDEFKPKVDTGKKKLRAN